MLLQLVKHHAKAAIQLSAHPPLPTPGPFGPQICFRYDSGPGELHVSHLFNHTKSSIIADQKSCSLGAYVLEITENFVILTMEFIVEVVIVYYEGVEYFLLPK